MAKASNHYINNKSLYGVMLKYHREYHEAKRNGTTLPRIPEYVGECLLKIADGLARRPNFSGYSYIEEMKMDGIMDCMKYLHNFNPDKYDKPFSYFNRIIWQAFLRRIDKEKKQQYVKYKTSMQVESSIYYMDTEHSPEMQDKIRALEDKYEKKKEK